jgi:hypothetical protein
VAQIKSVQSQLTAANSTATSLGTTTTSSAATALEQELGALIAQRAAALSAIAQTSVAGRPSLAVVSVATAGKKTTPKPGLYALVGFLVALLIAARGAVYISARRRAAAAARAYARRVATT